MNQWITIFVFLLCLGQSSTYGQWANASKPDPGQKFSYGGSGTKFNGTVKVNYFVESENRREALDSIDTIDLNEYRGMLRFVAEISDLRLGLNGSYDGVKNSDHPKVFYLEVIRLQPTNKDWVSPIAADTVKISAQGGHFGKNENRIQFGIKSVDTKNQILFRFKLRIRDGIYDRDWDGPIISKKLIFLPKIPEIKDTVATIAEVQNSEKRPVYYDRRYEPKASENDALNQPETIEDKLWAKIEEDLISDNKKSLLQRCQIYKMNCDQRIFNDCEYSEDILFFMASLVEDSEKQALIDEYKTQYPSGKYIDQIDGLIVVSKKTIIPIKEDLAKLDNDNKVLLVNRVEGGNRPYHVGFFDYAKNKDYAIKSIGFNSDAISLDLSELEIAEGSYTVKITDSADQVFVEKTGVYVSEEMQIPNSVKLIVIIGLIGVLGLLYKKYIYF